MPGAAHPWADSWAPAQFVFGSGGAPGPLQAPDANPPAMNSGSNSNYDTTLHWKLAGTIIGALLMVFVLQQLGFRFVVAAGVGR